MEEGKGQAWACEKKKVIDLYIKSHKGPGLALDSARLGRL